MIATLNSCQFRLLKISKYTLLRMGQPERIKEWYLRRKIRSKKTPTLTLPSADRAMHLRMVVFPAFGRPMISARNRRICCRISSSESIAELCYRRWDTSIPRWEWVKYLLRGCSNRRRDHRGNWTRWKKGVKGVKGDVALCYRNSEMFGPVDRTFAQTSMAVGQKTCNRMTSETPSKLLLEPQSMHFEFNVSEPWARLGIGFSGDKIFVPFTRHRCTWKG